MRGIKLVYQLDSMSCGAACLSMICHQFGRTVSIDTLSQILHIDKDGVSAIAICEAAKKVGLIGDVFLSNIKTLQVQSLPLILHWDQKHYVVLFKISKNGKKYKIADPKKEL